MCFIEKLWVVCLLKLACLTGTHPPTHTHTRCTHKHINITQGAYNQFYEADVRAWYLPSKFNAKPYHSADPQRLSDVAIVHFHGPKPADYLEFAETGACPRYGFEIVRYFESGCFVLHCVQQGSSAARACSQSSCQHAHMHSLALVHTPRFGGMCAAGLAGRACAFAHEWVRRLEGDEGADAYARWRRGSCGARP